uniref:Complex 1 LYR protein domain-containing protein n=1 Tax=Acanthochromis polyacanthus TaxID=80966 RepID=A0A3Q1EV45_9TELE
MSHFHIYILDFSKLVTEILSPPPALIGWRLGPMSRHSKLQKQVLVLYRQFLRAGRDKPGFIPRIRDEFRENAGIKRTDVMHIEYLYRRGQRQLEQLRDANTKQLGSFSKAKDQD